MLSIGQCTRRIIDCGITGCHFDQTVFWSLFTAGIPVVEESMLLSPANDPPFSHHRRRRKRLGAGRTRTLSIFPRAPPFTERRIVAKRRYYRDYRSDCGAIVLETGHEALKNNYLSPLLDHWARSDLLKSTARQCSAMLKARTPTEKGTFEKNSGPYSQRDW